MRRLTDASGIVSRPASPTQTETKPLAGHHSLLALQQAVGNRTVAALVSSVQRCGDGVHAGCPCAEDEHAQTVAGADLQRVASDPAVPRQQERLPSDLTGTVFEKLDGALKAKLADQVVFPWTKPTLAETLDALSNQAVTILARIGAMISATSARFIWDYVAKIEPGGWVTDNFGMGIQWTDGAGLGKRLAAHSDFCKDNPRTAQHYHGTTNAYRQIPRPPLSSGSPALHVVTDGKTEIHIDAHQPVEGKTAEGQCDYDVRQWLSHAADVTLGLGGARDTPLGRFSVARGAPENLRHSSVYDKVKDEPSLGDADRLLTDISMRVQRYAALGAMIGDKWEGDVEMLKDAPVMTALEKAEGLIAGVRLTQASRDVVPRSGNPGSKWWKV